MKFLIFVFTCFLVLFLSQAYGQIHVRLFQAHDAITQTAVAPKTHLENHIYFYVATPHQLWEISLEGSHQELLFVLPDEQSIETLSVADQSFLDSLVESTLITQPEYLREKLVQHIANIWTVGDDQLLVHVISQVCDRFSGYNWPACAGYSTLHLFNIDSRTLSLPLYRWDFHQDNQDASCDRPSNNIREIIPGEHQALIVTAPNCSINAPKQLSLLNYKTGDVDIIPAAVSRPFYALSPDGNSLAYIDLSACSNIACSEGTSVTIYRDGYIRDVPEIVVTPNSYRSLKLIWEDNDLLIVLYNLYDFQRMARFQISTDQLDIMPFPYLIPSRVFRLQDAFFFYDSDELIFWQGNAEQEPPFTLDTEALRHGQLFRNSIEYDYLFLTWATANPIVDSEVIPDLEPVLKILTACNKILEIPLPPFEDWSSNRIYPPLAYVPAAPPILVCGN